MANFKFGVNHQQNGKIIYNEGIVNGIVALAVNEVEGVALASVEKRSISLYNEREGIYVDVYVVVQYGGNIPDLAYKLQQSIKQSVENMTRYKVANVDVHIQDVVFPTDVNQNTIENNSNGAETPEQTTEE